MRSTAKVLGSLALACVLAGCGRAEDSHTSSPKAWEQGNERPRRVHIGVEAADALGVRIAEAGPAPLREILPLYGVIRPNGERVRNVSARFPGVIKAVHASAGQSVVAGQPLATVESNDSLEAYSVNAPISGVVTGKFANPGETVGDHPMFVVTDLSSVWVELTLFPNDLPHVRVGQRVHVRTVDRGLEDIAKVTWVSSVGESASQSVSARAVLSNASRQWRPGLYVSAELAISESVVPLAVASTAVQTLGQQSVVFVATGEEYAVRPVRLGRSDGTVTEVLDGLRVGEKYVADNSFLIKAELEKAPAEQEQD